MNNGPEGPVARVFVRNGRLMMLLSEDEEAIPLNRSSPWVQGLFRIGKAEYSPERARFDTIVDRRGTAPLRLRGAALSQGYSMIALALALAPQGF